jgi:hypothetical protein
VVQVDRKAVCAGKSRFDRHHQVAQFIISRILGRHNGRASGPLQRVYKFGVRRIRFPDAHKHKQGLLLIKSLVSACKSCHPYSLLPFARCVPGTHLVLASTERNEPSRQIRATSFLDVEAVHRAYSAHDVNPHHVFRTACGNDVAPKSLDIQVGRKPSNGFRCFDNTRGTTIRTPQGGRIGYERRGSTKRYSTVIYWPFSISPHPAKALTSASPHPSSSSISEPAVPLAHAHPVGYLSGLSRREQAVYFFREVVGVRMVDRDILSLSGLNRRTRISI